MPALAMQRQLRNNFAELRLPAGNVNWNSYAVLRINFKKLYVEQRNPFRRIKGRALLLFEGGLVEKFDECAEQVGKVYK